jgi:hypothetical protein
MILCVKSAIAAAPAAGALDTALVPGPPASLAKEPLAAAGAKDILSPPGARGPGVKKGLQ